MSRSHFTPSILPPPVFNEHGKVRAAGMPILRMPPTEAMTLGLLPEKKPAYRTFLFSYGVCFVLLLVMTVAHLMFPDTIDSRLAYRVIDIVLQPEPIAPKPVPPPPAPKIEKLTPPPVPIEQPKLVVPKDLPKPKPQVVEKVQPPVVRPNIEAPKLPPAPVIPKVVATGSFGSSAPATVNAPIQKVQTGGFGDPAGLPGEGKKGARLTANAVGSFDLPQGPGKGNGTGGAKGIQGTVASAGFGNGIAQPVQGSGRGNGQVQTAGFGSQQVASNTGKHLQENSGPPTTSVEILDKPKPVYTDEARKLKLEGEVLLEVNFRANGELTVNRVLRGLGHGLDEAAVNAAGKIKFKPALRNGTPVDSTAVVHVLFQLAS
jgi:TonB family protein